MPVMTNVEAAPRRLTRANRPRKSTRTAAVSFSGPAARSVSATMWWSMSIHVASNRKAMNTKRNVTLNVAEDVATRRKNDRKPALRRSRRERRRKSRPRIRNSSRCTMPCSAVLARYNRSIAMATAEAPTSPQDTHGRRAPRSRAPSSHQLASIASTTRAAPETPIRSASRSPATPSQTSRYVTSRSARYGDIRTASRGTRDMATSGQPHADLTQGRERAVILAHGRRGERGRTRVVECERLEHGLEMAPAAPEPDVETWPHELHAGPETNQVGGQRGRLR